jgi:hypothetical protein
MRKIQELFPPLTEAGVYETRDVPEDVLAPNLKEVLDILPEGAWVAGSAAMAVHDILVPPVARVRGKGSFSDDAPTLVTPKALSYKDIDVFNRDENVLTKVCDALRELDYERSRVSKVSIHWTRGDDAPVQVINFAGFPTVEDCLDVFDFATCCFAIYREGDAYKLKYLVRAADLLPRRVLALRHLHTPIASLHRAFKYIERGFLAPVEVYMQIFKVGAAMAEAHPDPKEYLMEAFYGWLRGLQQQSPEIEETKISKTESVNAVVSVLGSFDRTTEELECKKCSTSGVSPSTDAASTSNLFDL